MTPAVPPLFVHWEETVGDLLDRTLRFPKSARFTFAHRIDTLALDVVERLVEARFARAERKIAALAEVDRMLARLRVLLRLSHRRGYLDHRGFEHVIRNVDGAGKMVGGWLEQARSR